MSGSDDAFLRELCRVLLTDGWSLLDPFVHHRLRVGRLVGLVVTVAAIAHQIDHDVAMEFVAVHHREPHSRETRLRIVGVHVHDRRIEAFGEIARVVGGAAFARFGGEADLIVEDQMERAAGRVAGKSREIEGLRDDALARERGVSVQQDRERDVHVELHRRTAPIRLVRAGATLDDRIHRFQMAGIGRNHHGDVLAARRVVHPLSAVVILHVTGTGVPPFRFSRLLAATALELCEDRFIWNVHDVRQHVESSTVRHADGRLARSVRRGELQREIEHRHRHVEAFDRESLLAEVCLVQEALERVDRRQPRQQLLLSVRRERPPMLARFDHLPEPQALLVTPDVFDLVGDRATVGRLEIRKRVRECLAWHIDAERFGWDSRHDFRRESQPADVEGRIAGRLAAEGIEMGGEVAEIPVGSD